MGDTPETDLDSGAALAAVAALALVALLAFALAGGPDARSASDRDCGDFATQASAQSFFAGAGGPSSDPHSLDADGDGVACESLPCPCSKGSGGDGAGGGGRADKPKEKGCARSRKAVEVRLSRRRYPHIVKHIRQSWRLGYPRKLKIWRRGADTRRDKLLEGVPTRDGFDRDEAPAAVLRRKVRAHVRYVPSRENRAAGASLGAQISRYCDGVRVRYRFTR